MTSLSMLVVGILLRLKAALSYPLGLLYIGLFGLGSILGMALMSVAIAIPLHLSADRLGRLHWGMAAGVGATAKITGSNSCRPDFIRLARTVKRPQPNPRSRKTPAKLAASPSPRDLAEYA